MKTLLLCSSDVMAIPAALKLKEAGLLAAVAVPAKHSARLLPSFVQTGFDKHVLHTLNKESLADGILELLEHYSADKIMVITFPWKLPNSILDKMPNACFNFHPGPLPRYRGTDPIFWQVRNRQPKAGFTIHLMTHDIDAGPIVMMQEFPLMAGETYGMLAQKMAWLMAESMPRIIDSIHKGKDGFVEQETPQETLLLKKPTPEQLLIHWSSQSAHEIEALVNASNPRYHGAITSFEGRQLQLLEVAIATLNNAPTNCIPGQVVYADNVYGPIVSCINNEFVKINTVCTEEGFLSGAKLFAMGCTSGKYLV